MWSRAERLGRHSVSETFVSSYRCDKDAPEKAKLAVYSKVPDFSLDDVEGLYAGLRNLELINVHFDTSVKYTSFL